MQNQKEKKSLDIQYNDLNRCSWKSLLEPSRPSILETKTRFQDSFDAINNRMKEVFSKLFGGGYSGA